MVKRLIDKEISIVNAMFLGEDNEKVSFTLTEQENNTLYCSLMLYNKATLNNIFQASRNYSVTHKELEKIAASLGSLSTVELNRTWAAVENDKNPHQEKGWVTDINTPRDGGYKMYSVFSNAYTFFTGKDVEYHDEY